MTSKKNINENGEVDGESITYYKDGKLESKGNYLNGERNGYWELYWYTGQLKMKGNYKNGKFDGEWREYIEGNLHLVNTYCDGVLDGESESHYSNGQINWKGQYKNDKLEGEWVYYDIHGNIVEKGSYLNGLRHGLWQEEGEIVNHYNDGKRVSTESEKQEFIRLENLNKQKTAAAQKFFIKSVVIAVLLIGLIIFLLVK